MDRETRQQILWMAIIGACSLASGFLAGVSVSLPTAKERGLELRVAELESALAITRSAPAVEVSVQSADGIGISTKQVEQSLPHFTFSKVATNAGFQSSVGSSSSGVQVVLIGPPEDLMAIQVIGSITDPQFAEPTSFVLGIMLNLVTPTWEPDARMKWFAKVIAVTDHNLNVFDVHGGVRVNYLPMEIDGSQIQVVSFVRDVSFVRK